MMLAHADNLANTVDHEEMEQYMEQMMGFDQNQDQDQSQAYAGYPMMGWMHGYSSQSGYGQLYGLLHLVSWVLVMALIVAATRYLWNKGGEKK